MLLELFALLFFTYAMSVLSSIFVMYGVLRAFSTEKIKGAITVEKPVDNLTPVECGVCGARYLYTEAELEIRRRPIA
jgi:5,10-methylene-tetrahydrofolate dehydrogenase/methenyl tetrahydrofolate cyclohydrolase